ncbi:acyl-CoA dehydrogenase [Papillibacter cinnamivorans]|uniref:Butyryl-CoA dehydrogenase n=1 Tax=Papillibacter cinnamivorans DSM 12816 TaxID=1122930 RepID=A0A1W2BEG1_9FIRM|nr:acyl-CoA dehydrogenase [Papillibacter cinnamivorans]SMC71397.1 butyryl-CoA dehydrogenase [Papillibacter cinnamivorans DSM 12816]
MDFVLNDTQNEIRDLVRKFAEAEIKPIARQLDAEARYPYETMKKIGEMGLMGMPFPAQYGGGEMDHISYAIAIEELSRVCASHGVIVQTHCALCCWPILEYGTEEQKRKYLPDLLSGKKLGAFGLTEPNAGTDAAGQQTVAVDMGDHWKINGSKIFISGGGIAEVYVVFAMSDKSQGTKGITAFIIEKGTPGFSFGKKEDKMGIRASCATELVFEDCAIPKENLLGQVGKGFKIAMTALDFGRIGIASQALGIAQGAFEEAVNYMKTRKQFNKPLSAFQAMAFEMAEMKTRIDCARLLIYRAADCRDKGLPSTVAAAQAKLYASETAMYVTTKAVQFHGGYGYTKEYPVERMMRDAKITEIYEGTSEVMKMVISGEIFR